MASFNKKNKLKNSHFVASIIKNTIEHFKRYYFYTPSQRRVLKKIDLKKELENS